LAFFDAIAPIVHRDTIDMSKAWLQSRYDKAGPGGSGADYVNCPLDRGEYEAFVDALLAGNFDTFVSALSHLALPSVTLAFVYGGPIFKMVRSSMEAALRSDYTVYAEGLGLPRRTILLWAMRNAAPPVVVVTGVVAGYLLGGAVLIETVFNLNGIGQYAVQSITTADYAPIQGFVLVAAVFTMIIYLFVDLLQFMIDPRVSERAF